MEEQTSYWKLRYDRATQREQLRRKAIDALNAVRVDKFLTWPMLADRLNKKKVTNHLGRKWNGRMLAEFVRIHEASTGVQLIPWMGCAGSRKGKERLAEGRASYLAKRRSLREVRADEIREHCSKLHHYSEGVAALNANGCRTQSGRWTVIRLGDFVRRYEKECGEKLMPLVELSPGLLPGGRRG